MSPVPWCLVPGFLNNSDLPAPLQQCPIHLHGHSIRHVWTTLENQKVLSLLPQAGPQLAT